MFRALFRVVPGCSGQGSFLRCSAPRWNISEGVPGEVPAPTPPTLLMADISPDGEEAAQAAQAAPAGETKDRSRVAVKRRHVATMAEAKLDRVGVAPFANAFCVARVERPLFLDQRFGPLSQVKVVHRPVCPPIDSARPAAWHAVRARWSVKTRQRKRCAAKSALCAGLPARALASSRKVGFPDMT